jgi:hypothetical protein
VFTILYQLVGIGILVEVPRRLGYAFVAVRERERSARSAEADRPAAPPYS